MSTTHASPAVVRVTVASATRKVDLSVPGSVPVVELVPELARSVGLLDGGGGTVGHHLLLGPDRLLDPGTGLRAQGVEDGALLTLVSRSDDLAPPRYDDLAEAVGDAVERLPAWRPAASRRTWIAGAVAALGLGVVALFAQGGAGAQAALLAVGLAGLAMALSRWADDVVAAVAGWASAACAATAGAQVSGGHLGAGPSLASAGGAILLVGAACIVGAGGSRAMFLPLPVVGVVVAASGLLAPASGLDPVVVLTSAMVLVVLAGETLPAAALGLVGPGTGSAPGHVDPLRVAADVRLAHEILTGVAAGVGSVVVLVAPLALTLGRAGAVLAGCCCLSVLLGARRFAVRSVVAAGVVTGAAGLVLVVACGVWRFPDARPATALLGIGLGVAMLAIAGTGAWGSVRLRRLGDVVAAAALLSLAPLLAVAVGLLDTVLG